MYKKSIAAQRPFKLALLASIAAVALSGTSSFAATSTSASASATVMLPISITKATDLAFGKFIAAGSGGDVTIDTAGARTGTGVTLVNSTVGAASFTIGGEPNATYAIDFTGSSATVGNGTDTMALTLISDLTAGGATSGSVASGTLDGTGAQTLYVGGKLTVAGTESSGAYSGSIAVAVNYN
jgi:hypothetical protein